MIPELIAYYFGFALGTIGGIVFTLVLKLEMKFYMYILNAIKHAFFPKQTNPNS